MEERFEVSPKDSDFSVKKHNATTTEMDLLVSNHPTWSTRYKCYLTFFCFVLCYTNILRFLISMGKYKIIIFIPYLFYNIFVGVPALLVEVMLGRFVMGNTSLIWHMCPPARGIFWCVFAVTGYLIVLNYFATTFLFKYLFSCFHGFLKWESCDEPWARINCYKTGKKSDAISRCMKINSEEYCHNLTWESSGTQFWKYNLGNKEGIKDIGLTVLYLVLSILCVGLILYKKIRSLEKMLGLFVYPSLVLWVILLFVSFSAANALFGFKELCRFRWSDIIEPKIWITAFEDTICFLGLGKLTLSFISSRGKFTDNILFDVLVVIFGNFSACLLIGFPILNVIAGNKNPDESEKDKPLFEDINDIFISVSEALLFYPYPKTLWAFLYYFSCILVSISSQAVLVLSFCESLEVVCNKKKSEKVYILIISIASVGFFILGVVGRFLQFMKDLNQATVVVVITLLCTITWQTCYGIRKFNYDYHFMMGNPIPIFFKITWITLPALTFMGLVLKIYYRVPDQPLDWIVYLYSAIILIIYLFVILCEIFMCYMSKEKISKVFLANPNWGPDNPLLKKSRMVFDTSTVNKEFMYRQELFKKPFKEAPDFSEQNIVQVV